MVNADGWSRDAADAADQDAMDIAWLETAAYWSKVVAVTFAVLAALGTGFAVYFSSRMVAAKDADLERVRAESMLEIAASEAKATRAIQDAAAAQAAADAANERAARLEAAATRERTAPARAELGVAVAPTAGVASRLTDDQREAMMSVLKRARAPRTVVLSWAAHTEPYALAREVRRILQDAGWVVRSTGGVLSATTPPTGVSLTTSILSDDALLLQSAFDAAGMHVRMVLEPAQPEGQLTLTIGERAEGEHE
jgi:hypothetical protein